MKINSLYFKSHINFILFLFKKIVAEKCTVIELPGLLDRTISSSSSSIHNNFQIKPNTIFLAHVRLMHWVCISNIYLSSNTRNIDKELYVVYDCFTKGSSSCCTHVDWLNGFSFFIEKLSPHLKKIAFYTVEIGFKVEADPALLAFAYAVSIAEERHPAANHFEENELMV